MTGSKTILFVAPPYTGHSNQLIVLASELVRRGHQVRFANAEAFRKPINDAGATFVAWEPERAMTDPKILRRRHEVWKVASRERSILRGERRMLEVAVDAYVPMHRTLLPIFDEYLPDLVIADSAAVPAIDLAAERGISRIVVAQFLGDHAKMEGHLPRYGTPFLRKMSVVESLLNFAHPLLAFAHFTPSYLRLIRLRRQCGITTPVLGIYRDNPMLVCTTFGVELARPLPARIQMVGPILPRNSQSLDPELQAWLDEPAKAPVVFMSFGTLSCLEPWQVRALLEALAQEPVRVLWALRESEQRLLPSIPTHMRICVFLPQQTVLAHAAVQCFVSHCGMNSVSESLYFAKPLLALPIFGDQHFNAARLVDLGVALRLNKQAFTAQEVREKLRAILTDPRYRQAAERAAVSLHEAGGLEKACSLVETILPTGSRHFVQAGSSWANGKS